MRLISCYIEGYGSMRKRSFDFESKTNVFCEENGFGKTTLASFIKAMFYGLDSYKVNTSDFVDRKHFYPFDGGVFGGNVVFSYKGDEYKIERRFDEKSNTRDTLTVYKNSNEISFEECPGEYFFGIDRDGFERTVFITADEIEISSTDSISAKLNDFAIGSEDISSALALIEKEKKKYKKSRNGIDLISREKNERDSLRRGIEHRKELLETLPEKYSALENIKKEIAELNCKIDAARLAKDWKFYDELSETVLSEKKKITEIAAKYPAGIPDKEELDAALRAQNRAEALSEHTVKFENSERLKTLEKKFAAGVPSAEALLKAEKLSGDLSVLIKEKEATEEKIAALDVDEKILPDLKLATEKFRADTVSAPSNGKYIVAAVLSFVALAAGAAVAFWNIAVGVAVAAVGFIGLFLTAFLYLNGKTKTRSGSVAEAELRKLLLKNGVYVDGNPEFAAENLIAKIEEKVALSEKLRRISEEISVAKASLKRFSEKFGGSTLAELRGDVADYSALVSARKGQEERNENVRAEIEESQKTLTAFTEKYGILPESIGTAVADAERLKSAKTSYLKAKENAEKFKLEKKLSERPDSTEDFAVLKKRKEELTVKALQAEDDIKTAEDYVSDSESLENEERESTERIEEYNRRYKLLSDTEIFLREADRRLKDRYVAPVKNNFVKYSEALESAVGEKISMASDFSVRYEKDGVFRSEKYLSAGQRSIVALCFRLALLDNMFTDEKPFLILDDPFSSLDSTHLQKVRDLLGNLCENFQIIYFTCHESRNI